MTITPYFRYFYTFLSKPLDKLDAFIQLQLLKLKQKYSPITPFAFKLKAEVTCSRIFDLS